MTIEKRPSGNYRIRHTVDKKTYSVTVPYKPTKKEAFEIIENRIAHRSNEPMTFKDAVDKYIDVKTDVLSPASIRQYHSLSRNIPEWFNTLVLSEIGTYEAQKLINEHSKAHEPKGTRNMWGFVSGVINMFQPSFDVSVALPQKIYKEVYSPTLDDVKRILEYAKGTEYYIPIYLATLSCRNSEICALTLEDLDGDALRINKALVKADGGYVLKKTPKTDKSNRIIVLPSDLVDAINEKGYIYKNYPRQITKFLHRAQKNLGIPSFGIHKMRYFFASYSHELGYSDAVIQEMGGWSTDNVMKSVYRHAMNKDQAAAQIKKDFSF